MAVHDHDRKAIHAGQTAAPQRLRLDRETGLGAVSAIAVALRSTANAWRLAIYAELIEARPWYVGTVVVPIPIVRGEGSHIVAIATVPGATSWIVDAMPDGIPAAPGEVAELEIAAADVGVAGLVAIGRAEIVGERLRYTADSLLAGASVITLATSRRIRRVSAWQDGTGGAMRVNGGAWIPLPPNGAATLETDQWAIGVASVAFSAIPAGGGGYSIEYEE
jgi:hypothetical protein